MTSNEVRSFHYKASRDIIGRLIWTFFACVVILTLQTLANSTDGVDRDVYKAFLVFVTIASILFVIYGAVDIYCNTFDCLTVSQDEITYSYGWLTKSTKTIPVNKILSCSKSSDMLQRACGTMSIAVTTECGENSIYFSNIENGDEAYQLISQLAKKQESKA